MCEVNLMTQGTTAGIHLNRLELRNENEILQSVPVHMIDSINVYGRIQITSQMMDFCLREGVPIILCSRNGSYKGKITSGAEVNVAMQRAQTRMYDNESSRLEFSRKILISKVHNQMVVLRRYAREKNRSVETECGEMKKIQKGMLTASSIPGLMGLEGGAARIYFACLGTMIDAPFCFKGRSKRPPRDPFNALISLGYTLISAEMARRIEARGLNPYFGLMHTDRNGHMALASDLIEEWRAEIVDSLAMRLLNRHELSREDFLQNENNGVYLTKAGMQVYLQRYRQKMEKSYRYLTEGGGSANVCQMMDLQIGRFIKYIRDGNVDNYLPVRIR